MLRGNTALSNLKYKVIDLITRIEENRASHETEFEEAKLEYRKSLEEELVKKLADLKEGRDVSPTINLPKPVQFLKEYDKALTMLGMTTEVEIVLDTETFSQLVLDEWHWKSSFEANTMSYASNKAGTARY